MAGEYKAACGCKIHVAQWTTKRKVVSQESCPLHKAALELLGTLLKLRHFAANNIPGQEDHSIWLEVAKVIAKAEGREWS